MDISPPTYTAFASSKQIASGELAEVASVIKKQIGKAVATDILIFADATGRVVDIDWRGSVDDVVNRLTGSDKKAGPGRPKLGVTSREVSLLPRHWDWLAKQPGGASVTLRKLVEEAKRSSTKQEGVRVAQEAAYRFMHTLAGDLPGFEDALRAMYAKDQSSFGQHIDSWPTDIKKHVQKILLATWEK